MVSIVASKTKFGVAETNPNGRLHAKNDNTARYLKTADAQDNLIGTKDEERTGWSLPFIRWRKNNGVSSNESVLKKTNPFKSSHTNSVEATSAKARAIALYNTKQMNQANVLVLGQNIAIILIVVLASFVGAKFLPRG